MLLGRLLEIRLFGHLQHQTVCRPVYAIVYVRVCVQEVFIRRRLCPGRTQGVNVERYMGAENVLYEQLLRKSLRDERPNEAHSSDRLRSPNTPRW